MLFLSSLSLVSLLAITNAQTITTVVNELTTLSTIIPATCDTECATFLTDFATCTADATTALETTCLCKTAFVTTLTTCTTCMTTSLTSTNDVNLALPAADLADLTTLCAAQTTALSSSTLSSTTTSSSSSSVVVTTSSDTSDLAESSTVVSSSSSSSSATSSVNTNPVTIYSTLAGQAFPTQTKSPSVFSGVERLEVRFRGEWVVVALLGVAGAGWVLV